MPDYLAFSARLYVYALLTNIVMITILLPGAAVCAPPKPAATTALAESDDEGMLSRDVLIRITPQKEVLVQEETLLRTQLRRFKAGFCRTLPARMSGAAAPELHYTIKWVTVDGRSIYSTDTNPAVDFIPPLQATPEGTEVCLGDPHNPLNKGTHKFAMFYSVRNLLQTMAKDEALLFRIGGVRAGSLQVRIELPEYATPATLTKIEYGIRQRVMAIDVFDASEVKKDIRGADRLELETAAPAGGVASVTLRSRGPVTPDDLFSVELAWPNPEYIEPEPAAVEIPTLTPEATPTEKPTFELTPDPTPEVTPTFTVNIAEGLTESGF